MHVCVSQHFQGGQGLLAPQKSEERQISKPVAVPYFLSSLPVPSQKGLEAWDFHPATSVLMHLSPQRAHGSAGARAKENTAGGDATAGARVLGLHTEFALAQAPRIAGSRAA